MRGMGGDFNPDSKIDWSIIRQIWPFLLEYKARIALAFICLIGAKLASVWMPFLLKAVVDDFDAQKSAQALIIVPVALLLAYGLARLLNSVLAEVRDTLFGRVTERAMRRIGLRVFEHLHNMDLAFHLNRRTGGLSRDIERGTNGIGFLMRFLVFNIVPTLLELLLVIGILWQQYSFKFAGVVLFSVMAYIWFSKATTDWRTRFIREANQADNLTHSRTVDSLLNFETVKYFTNEAHESALYDKELANWEQARRKNRLSLFVLNGGQACIVAVSLTIMLIMAAYEVSAGNMTLGDFVLVNAFMMQIFMPLNFLGFIYREIKSSMANIERMFDLLSTKPAITEADDAPDLRVSEGAIVLQDVGFAYDAQRTILNGVSIQIHAGEKLAIVGSSGAGKSTIAKLLFRFYDVTQGAIMIDGQNIRQVNQHSLRSAIGVVPQDAVLFNDTLLENVRYGRPDASDSEVEKAIELAHLSAFVESLPKRYATEVGERGLKLSGGEKQRVAIARTILKNPAILIFDEATSSLDSRSERAVLDAIEAVSKDKTTVVIAHRLSTIVNADRIVVLDNGKIVEQGTHNALLSKNGHYAQLWAMQQG